MATVFTSVVSIFLMDINARLLFIQAKTTSSELIKLQPLLTDCVCMGMRDNTLVRVRLIIHIAGAHMNSVLWLLEYSV